MTWTVCLTIRNISPRNAKKSNDKIKNLTQEIEDIKQRLQNMIEEKNKITVEGADVCKMLEAINVSHLFIHIF